jgi:hypothetical protein
MSPNRPQIMKRPSCFRPTFRLLAALSVSLTGAGLLVAPTATANRAASQTTATPASGPTRTLIRLEALGTPADGPTGVVRTRAHVALAAGEQATWFLGAGDGVASDLCQAAVNVEEPSQALIRWRIDVQLVSASTARATVMVRWTRARADGETYIQETAGRRVVTLDSGEYHVLDYVAAPPTASPACASLLIRLSVDAVPQAEPRSTLVYDIWLEYSGRLGRRSEHRHVTARSGVQTPFQFASMEWAIREAYPGQAEPPVRLDVSGTLLGTVQPNGFVDTAVGAQRRLSWVGGSVAGEGQLEYRSSLGEAAALLLPAPSGATRASLPPMTGPIEPGLTYRDGAWLLDYNRFLAGGITLYVVANRQPSGAGGTQ